MIERVLLLTLLSPTILSFRCYFPKASTRHSDKSIISSSLYNQDIDNEDNDSSFDPLEFEKALKSLNEMDFEKFKNPDPTIVNDLNASNKQSLLIKEELSRKYSYEDYQLPILPDCNNYYSGTYGDSFWLQNADQVFTYIPIASDVAARDIQIKFEAKGVTITIQTNKDSPKILQTIQCPEKIIPDGSFWTIETSKSSSSSFKDINKNPTSKPNENQRYILLDMEKRFRMINWKNLFSEAAEEDPADVSQRRQEMLSKLFAANKGIGKLNNKDDSDIEGMDEMMNNEDLMRMINSEVNTKPQIVTDGTDDFIRKLQLQQQLEESDFEGFATLNELTDSIEEGNNSNKKSTSNSSDIVDAEFEESKTNLL